MPRTSPSPKPASRPRTNSAARAPRRRASPRRRDAPRSPPPKPRRERPWPRGDRFGIRPEQRPLTAVEHEFEPRLMPADQLHIDGGEQPAVEQRAVLLALGKVDAVALAQRIEAARRARVAAPRQRQRVHHPVPAKQRPRQPLELGIEEGEIESGVVHHQHRAFDESRACRRQARGSAACRAGTRWRARAPRRPDSGMSRSGLRWQCHTRPVGMQLTSSTQPISTMRCPSNGSSPVVSVSSTISRK